MLQAMIFSKVKWIPVLWLAGIFSSQAQNSDERPLSDSAKVTKQADLSEVVIRGERMVTKHDRRLYYPTSEELERSPTVYSLLKRIPMPGVRIDETKQSVTSNLGYVPLYINDKVATQDELQSLTMQSIVRIEYIDRPGMRYGDNAYGVIRIVLQTIRLLQPAVTITMYSCVMLIPNHRNGTCKHLLRQENRAVRNKRGKRMR